MTEQRPYAAGGPIPPDADLSGIVKRGCPIQLPADPDDRDTFLRLFAEEFHAFQPRIVLTIGQECP